MQQEENQELQKLKNLIARSRSLNTSNEIQILHEMQETIKLFQEYKQQNNAIQANKEYFASFFVPNIVKNLLNYRQYQFVQSYNISELIINQAIEFIAENILYTDSLSLSELFKTIFDVSREYYKYNNQDENDQKLLGQIYIAPPAKLEWCRGLKTGDIIDAVKTDKYYNKYCWSKAMILTINSDDIMVEYLNEYSKEDTCLHLGSFEVAPPDTYSKDFNWRLSIQKGDLIDVCDTAHIWYNSTVLDRRVTQTERGQNVHEIRIGYRTYNPDGDRADDQGQAYFGWSEKFDVWISATSPRVSKFNSLAKQIYKLSSQANSEQPVDDSRDVIYQQDYSQHKFCSILRPNCINISIKSVTLVQFMNKFLNSKGFDVLLERFSNRNEWVSFDTITNYLYGLGSLYPLYYRYYAHEFIPRLWEIITDYVIQSPDTIVRSFDKEKCDVVFHVFDNLLKRVYSVGQKKQKLEFFQMQVVLKCFNSDFLQQKILAMKMISSTICKVNNDEYEFFTIDNLKKWIKENKIFVKIFSDQYNAHAQIIERSSDLMVFMFKQSLIQPQDMDNILTLIVQNLSSKEKIQSIFKVLNELSFWFQIDHIKVIVTRIYETSSDNILKEHIELLKQIFIKPLNKQSLYLINALNCLWNLADEGSQVHLQKLAQDEFVNLVKNLESKDQKQQFIVKCIENIQQSKSVCQSIKIMRYIIDSYTDMIYSSKKIVVQLQQEYNIIQMILENIQSYKVKGVTTEYIDGLEIRFNFIKFLSASLQEDQLSKFELLSTIWRIMVTESLIPQEKDIVFKWLKGMNKDKEYQLELIRFFNMVVIKDQTSIHDMSTTGFECIKQLFILCNENNKKLVQKILGKTNVVFKSLDSKDKVLSVTNASVEEQKFEFDYQIDVDPQELDGIQIFWDLAEQLKDKNLIKKVAEFLTQIYTNLTFSMQEKSQIDFRFIKICIQKLRSITQSQNINDQQERIFSYLKLMRIFIQESENAGVGSLRSHSSLVKGELIILQVLNNFQNVSDQSQKFEIQMYTNKTIMDLRKEIASQLKTSWDQVKIKSNQVFSREITDSDNGRTISDFRFKNNETLTVLRRTPPPIPQAQLVDKQGALLEKPKQIFTTLFYNFANKQTQLMDPQELANFTTACTSANVCKVDDSRVIDFFLSHDRNRDGFLELEDFLRFYNQSCIDKPHSVWANLKYFQYRNDFKTMEEVNQDQIDIKKLPTYFLMQNQDFYTLLFQILGFSTDEDLNKQIWALLQHLPTSKSIMEKVLKLEGIVGCEANDWSQVFDESSNCKLLYVLTIVEYMMEDDEEESEDSMVQERVKSQEWRQDFIQYGGFEQLLRIFQKFVQKLQPTVLEKNILSFILKIMKIYLIAALHSKIPHIYKITQYGRSTLLSLDTIDENLKESEDQSKQISDLNKIQEEINPKNDTDKQEGIKKYNIKIKEPKEFLLLSDRLRSGLGQKIIDTLNLPQLFQEIIKVVTYIVSFTGELESEDRLILDLGMCILVAIFLSSEECLAAFISNTNSDQLIINGLFCSRSNNIRKIFSHCLYLLVRQTHGYLHKWLINLLIQNLPTSASLNLNNCNQYYELLCKIIEKSDLENGFGPLLSNIMNQIENHISQEKISQTKNDTILTGFLNLYEKLIRIQSDLCEYLEKDLCYFLNTCLFSQNYQQYAENFLTDQLHDVEYQPPNYVKCKSMMSRNSSYKIVNQIVSKNKKCLSFVLKNVESILDQLTFITTWNFKPSNNQKGYFGYVGIKNLGSTCYMNAMLQQFFLIPTFRYLILSSQDKQQKIQKEYYGVQQSELGKIVDDNLLHQLQSLFASLELSDRQDYNPYQFCFSYKDFDSQPINVCIQQDAQEFLNRMFDMLENGLKHTPYKYVTQSIFGGKTCSQLKCMECGNIKENYELFYNLSLTVKNMKSMQESLDSMIKDEKINDYFCEICQKKQDITKKLCLSYLPNILIVHLQRIVFDMDTLMNSKINTRFEFPFLLDLQQHTEEGINEGMEQKEKDYYTYKLKGVVVHMGTAASGHYLSYINYKEDKWLEFNDSNVIDFDIKQFEQECFGGGVNQDDWIENKEDNEQGKSAYILVYERQSKDPLQLVYSSDLEKQQILEDVKIHSSSVLEDQQGVFKIDYYGVKRNINKCQFIEVWLDNHLNMLEKHFYNSDFLHFIKNAILEIELPSDYLKQDINTSWNVEVTLYKGTISQEQKELYIYAIEFLQKLITKIVSKISEKQIMNIFLIQIRSFLDLVPEYASTFFIKNCKDKFIIDMMLTCPEMHVRKIFSLLCGYCLNLMITYNNLELTDSEMMQNEKQTIMVVTINEFISYSVGILNTEVAKNWTRMNEFLELIRDFVKSGNQQLDLAFKEQLIARLIDFYLQKDSPVKCFGDKKNIMGNNYIQPQFDVVIQILAEMIPRTQWMNNISPKQGSVKIYQLSQNDILCLNNYSFYYKTLKKNYDVKAFGIICSYLCIYQINFSKNLAQIILDGISPQRSKIDEIQPYLEVMQYFLLIDDNLKTQRVEWLLGVPVIYPNKYCNYGLYGNLEDMNISYISTCGNNNYTNESILQFMFESRKRQENYVILILSQFLDLLDQSEFLRDYVMMLPPPNYINAKYIDWIYQFLVQYIDDAKKYQMYNLSFNREQVATKTLEKYLQVQNKIYQKINYLIAINQQINPQINQKPMSMMEVSVNPCYILGNICGQFVQNREILLQKNDKFVTLITYEIQVYLVESMPNGYTNLAIPDVSKDQSNYINTYNFDKTSNICQIIQEEEVTSKNADIESQKANDHPVPLLAPGSIHSLQSDFNFGSAKQAEYVPPDTPAIVISGIEEEKTNVIALPNDSQGNNQQFDKIICNINNIKKINYIRKIVVQNDTNDSYQFNLDFNVDPKSPQFGINCYIPSSAITKQISPGSEQIIWSMNKRNIYMDWGHYEYQSNLVQTNFIKNDEQQQKIKPNSDVQEFQQGASYIPDLDLTNADEWQAASTSLNKEISYTQDAIYNDEEQGKNCKVCTLLNPIDAKTCEVCDTPF